MRSVKIKGLENNRIYGILLLLLLLLFTTFNSCIYMNSFQQCSIEYILYKVLINNLFLMNYISDSYVKSLEIMNFGVLCTLVLETVG